MISKKEISQNLAENIMIRGFSQDIKLKLENFYKGIQGFLF